MASSQPPRVDFYRLSRDPAARVAAAIADKLAASAQPLLVVDADPDRLARLDRDLWDGPPASFRAHGIANGGVGDAAQPILLVSELPQMSAPGAANAARHVVLADGLWRPAALAFDRVFLLFDTPHIDAARLAWRALTQAGGAELHFWRQDERGRWAEGP